MKKLFLALLLSCCLLSVWAQSYEPEDLVKFKQDTVARVYVSRIKPNQVYIPLDFNSAEIKDISAYREVKNFPIMKVELVYTAYSKSEYFNQPKLNIDRLNVLKATAPEVFAGSITQWKFTAQTDCKNEDEARQLFHGFVITYRPEMLKPSDSIQIGRIFHTVEKYTDPDYDKKIAAKPVAYKGERRMDLATAFAKPDNYIDLRDSVVLNVLKRNKDWKGVSVVCDATGSMMPYVTQTLIWLKLNHNKMQVQNYTFFNDGDNMPDHEKVIGKTGGVYCGKATTYDSVANLMFKTILKGTGGDGPENNIEALLKTIAENPDCKEIVMIADNPAPVKDIALLSKLNKPVHIILCGASTGINSDYLTIARATGGSIHTMEQDILNLVELNEGEIFQFKGQRFKIEKGKFRLVFGA